MSGFYPVPSKTAASVRGSRRYSSRGMGGLSPWDNDKLTWAAGYRDSPNGRDLYMATLRDWMDQTQASINAIRVWLEEHHRLERGEKRTHAIAVLLARLRSTGAPTELSQYMVAELVGLDHKQTRAALKLAVDLRLVARTDGRVCEDGTWEPGWTAVCGVRDEWRRCASTWEWGEAVLEDSGDLFNVTPLEELPPRTCVLSGCPAEVAGRQKFCSERCRSRHRRGQTWEPRLEARQASPSTLSTRDDVAGPTASRAGGKDGPSNGVDRVIPPTTRPAAAAPSRPAGIPPKLCHPPDSNYPSEGAARAREIVELRETSCGSGCRAGPKTMALTDPSRSGAAPTWDLLPRRNDITLFERRTGRYDGLSSALEKVSSYRPVARHVRTLARQWVLAGSSGIRVDAVKHRSPRTPFYCGRWHHAVQDTPRGLRPNVSVGPQDCCVSFDLSTAHAYEAATLSGDDSLLGYLDSPKGYEKLARVLTGIELPRKQSKKAVLSYLNGRTVWGMHKWLTGEHPKDAWPHRVPLPRGVSRQKIEVGFQEFARRFPILTAWFAWLEGKAKDLTIASTLEIPLPSGDALRWRPSGPDEVATLRRRPHKIRSRILTSVESLIIAPVEWEQPHRCLDIHDGFLLAISPDQADDEGLRIAQELQASAKRLLEVDVPVQLGWGSTWGAAEESADRDWRQSL